MCLLDLLYCFQQESTSYCSCRGSCGSCRIILLSQQHILAECLAHYVLSIHVLLFIWFINTLEQFYFVPFVQYQIIASNKNVVTSLAEYKS